MFALCIESSHLRGMGHFYRMLNLAETLIADGVAFKFYLNDDESSLQILRELDLPYQVVYLEDYTSNWEASLIRQDRITLWVNDRLDTNESHAQKIRLAGVPLVTFDDRGKGALLANLHVAAFAFDDKEPLGGEKILRGVDYLILNPKIEKFTRIRKNLSSILVTLGGSDSYGVTVKVVKLLKEMNLQATIIVGPAFKHMDNLNEILTKDFILKRNVPSLIEEFYRHDLAITGGGITPFEANASGLPCVVIANELLEIPVAKKLQALGGAVFIGHHESIHAPLFMADTSLEQMSLSGIQNIRLQGLRRVIDAIYQIKNE